MENIAGEGGAIPEDSHDAGQKAINYGTEPAWFRFGLDADANFETELAAVNEPEMLYANDLVGSDPATPVFTAEPGQEVRMRLLLPTGVGRGTTFDLHGHVWQRDPYLKGAVPSQNIGNNPDGLYLGHQESVTPAAHFDVVLPRAGGTGGQKATTCSATTGLSATPTACGASCGWRSNRKTRRRRLLSCHPGMNLPSM